MAITKIKLGNPFFNEEQLNNFIKRNCESCKKYYKNNNAQDDIELQNRCGCSIINSAILAFHNKDKTLFPSDTLVELRDNDNHIIRYHSCLKFSHIDTTT